MMRSSVAVLLAIVAITAGRPVGRGDRQLQSEDPTETRPSTARRREGNATKLAAPRSCASYPVVSGKSTCPKDRCSSGGWFCAPLPTGQAAGASNAAACERARTKGDCASAGGDGTCRCNWGPHPVGKKHGKSEICAPRPAFATPTDTCTIGGAAAAALPTGPAAPKCNGFKTKGGLPEAQLRLGRLVLPTPSHGQNGLPRQQRRRLRDIEDCRPMLEQRRRRQVPLHLRRAPTGQEVQAAGLEP